MDKISAVTEILIADNAISLGLSEESGEEDDTVLETGGDGGHGLGAVGRCNAPLVPHKHETLKQSCPTRWNSILVMISSIIDLWTEFNEALKVNGDREHCLSENDKTVLGELQQFLQPFHDLTELVSSEQPHLGMIPLIVREVNDATKHEEDENEVIYRLKDIVRDRLPRRIKVTEAVQIATLLDPSMKGLITVDHTLDDLKELLAKHTKLAHDRMSRMTATVSASCGAVDSVSTETSGSSNTASVSNSRQVPDDNDNSAPSQISTQPLSKKMKLLEKFRGVGRDVDLANKIDNEVNTYLHREITNADENPLVFWKHQQHNFPFLSVLAKAYLSVSASSVPVEAMFSTSGLIVNQKRSSMAPFRANMASVIHDNYSKYYPISRVQAGQFKS